MNYINLIKENYDISNIINMECINNGKINNTYKIITNTKKYIFQKINSDVFNNPYNLIYNIENITNYLKQKNGNTLNLIHTKNNKSLIKIGNDYYRIYENIEGITYNKTDDLDIIYLIGKAFGNFEKNLIDYNHKLKITIEDFHNTPKIYNDFIENVKNKNINEIDNEVKFIKSKENIIYKIYNLLNVLPTRLIHGDTKISNVIINNKDFTVIDLDTVMYSTILYDYGDMIRSISDKTYLDLDKFKIVTKGYLGEMKNFLTKEEIDNMGISILIIILELGIRYLNDYVNGNIYFKTNNKKENIDKAKSLFELYNDIESKINIINNYIKEVVYE